jgi:hypothetical protein
VEVCLNKRFLADRDVDGRIYGRIFLGGPCVAENGKIVEVTEIPARWKRTNPCS